MSDHIGGPRSNMRAWSWVRVDGRNVVAVPTQQQIHLYDSDDFILLSTLAPSGHASAIAKVRWSAFHAKLASLSATQLVIHAPQLMADDGDDRSDVKEKNKQTRHTKVQFAPVWQLQLQQKNDDSSDSDATRGIHSFSFSRCAERLLFSDSDGIGILDIHNYNAGSAPSPAAYGRSIPEAQVLWRITSHVAIANEIVKFSPSEFVFASLQAGQSRLKVWRMADDVDGDAATQEGHGEEGHRITTPVRFTKKLVRVDELAHPDPIVYYSWKPANSQLHAARTLDGSHKAQWFEPPRILLTCSNCRVIRIWTESDASDPSFSDSHVPTFTCVLVYQPHEPIDNFRWVLSKNRNISEEKFGSAHEQNRSQIDWISGVDRRGILHLWRLIGVPTATPRIEETGVCIQVNGAEGDTGGQHQQADSARMNLSDDVEPLSEICIMAYFSQDYFETPSAFDIILQRADNIILSYNVAVARKSLRPHVKRKSWYRSHSGSISALAAHPSLPLIASVGAEPTSSSSGQQSTSYEILIFWISFSAFSAESRLIPSGVLKCAQDCGDVLSVQWVPTLHFDATPLLLVAFASGTIEVYGRTANAAGVVSSPKRSRKKSLSHHQFGRSPSVSPWTFFDYSTGESRAEYEVAFHKHKQAGLGFSFESKDGKLIVSQVSNSTKRNSMDQVSLGDEIVSINHTSLIDKRPAELQELLDAIPTDEVAIVRFRAKSTTVRSPISTNFGTSSGFSDRGSKIDTGIPAMPSPTATSTDDDESSTEAHSQKPQSSFLSSALNDSLKIELEHSHVVRAGNVSMYGGWRQLLRMKVASSLALLCVCPVYADDGEYVPSTVLLFGITSLPGKLSAWKGAQSPSSKAYELTPLGIESSMILRKSDISSIAGERDYRQRAFSSKKQGEGSDTGLNSLLFMGDASGSIQHWRCQLSGEKLAFTLMSTVTASAQDTVPDATESTTNGAVSLGKFFRRGYVGPESGTEINTSAPSSTKKTKSASGSLLRGGIHHIEVDDPNRIAVLDVSRPDTLHIYEAESGLGVLRFEESISSGGRGNILGFCWCSAHVEFNVDVLAVHYSSGIVLYQYDMNVHRWTQIGNDIVTPYSIFDCTRDSSALLIGGGFLKPSGNQNKFELCTSDSEPGPVSNEMPDVLGKWDEPGSLLQYSMDWKATESPQKLPIWHPYVIITTLFGMHARVGLKDTQLAGDQPAYEFSKAFKDAVQMLKLLAKVVEDKVSAQVSSRSGVLSYSASRKANGGSSLGRRDSVGRYSTAVHTKSLSKAEHLFGDSLFGESDDMFSYQQQKPKIDSRSLEKLDKSEASIISECIDALLLHTYTESRENGTLLFASFDKEHFLEMKAILHYIDAVQSLGFEMDASAADLGAKRYFSSYLFANSLKCVLSDPKFTANPDSNHTKNETETSQENGDRGSEHSHSNEWASLDDSPSSGILWALHSDSQQFLLDNCVHPQATWDELRPMWLGLWVKNTKDLRTVVERYVDASDLRLIPAYELSANPFSCLYVGSRRAPLQRRRMPWTSVCFTLRWERRTCSEHSRRSRKPSRIR